MAIVTLTTDMGLSDYYVASLKGRLLSSQSNLNIVDISHTITPFNVSESAFLLQSCINDFPESTIHIIGVDSEPILNFGGHDGSFPCILEYKKQYIICNDNGFFGTFLAGNLAENFWRVTSIFDNANSLQFPAKNLFIPIAEKILEGISIDSFAEKSDRYKSAFTHSATAEINLIRGHILHIDSYGNALTNISKSLFDSVGKESPFVIYFKNKNYYIDEISDSYNSVPQGEKVGLFNENGLLEIAINRGANRSTGGAEQLFGLAIGNIIRVEFTPAGSRERLDSLF